MDCKWACVNELHGMRALAVLRSAHAVYHWSLQSCMSCTTAHHSPPPPSKWPAQRLGCKREVDSLVGLPCMRRNEQQ